MGTVIQEITVAKAKAYLEKNIAFERGVEGTNRPQNMRKVNDYAVEMLKGNWKFTHQGIGIGVKGDLKDGQHRLLAIVQAGEEGATDGETAYEANPKIKVRMLVTDGLADDIFDKVDIGFKRSSAQILAIAGYYNQSKLAASARLLYLFDNHDFKYWNRVVVTNQEILKVVKVSGINEYLPIGGKLSQTGFIGPAAIVGSYVCERAYPDGPHLAFIDSLFTGAGLSLDDPALALRNYMSRSKVAGKNRRSSFMHLALYIKAWNDTVNGIMRSSVAFRSNEDFPKPVER